MQGNLPRKQLFILALSQPIFRVPQEQLVSFLGCEHRNGGLAEPEPGCFLACR